MRKSKRLLCAAVAVALTMGMAGAAFAGCTAINHEIDIKQVVAKVDISKDENFKTEFSGYESAITEQKIIKRDLILSYINSGASSSGYSAGDMFASIANSLVSNAVMTQYATAALLQGKIDAKTEGYSLSNFNAIEGDDIDAEIKRYEYVLGGDASATSKGVMLAKYNLYKLINNTLDSYEKSNIDEEDGYTGTETRTTPGNVGEEKDKFYPTREDGSLDYFVYTGYKLENADYLTADFGVYEKLEGSTRLTRRKAYATFINYLKANYLISSKEDTGDILQLDYVKQTYATYLKSQILTEFSDSFEDGLRSKIETADENGVFVEVRDRYLRVRGEEEIDGEYVKQKNKYSALTSITSYMDSVSDSSFILYTPDTTEDTDMVEIDGNQTYGTYGFVYNILLPFSAKQSLDLKNLTNRRTNKNIDDYEFYTRRNALMQNIETTDQRAAWFNGSTVYAFDASESSLTDWYGRSEGKNYLFFEDNMLKTDRFKPLDKYIGQYAYNGRATKNEDGSYNLVPQKLDIDGMLDELISYVNYVVGAGSVKFGVGDSLGNLTAWDTNAEFFNAYNETTNSIYKAGTKDIDYSKFVYATGKVDVGNVKSVDMFVKEGENSKRYKAMSAINELQYAYTTDTGILSKYIGYSVSAYDTNYIKEFEYAAQQAIRMGAGTIKVCAGDYGWHIIYVTEAYTNYGGAVYTPVWTKERIETEGSFENLFYKWVKDSNLSDEVSRKQTVILQQYNTDSTVKKYESVYKDLTGLS